MPAGAEPALRALVQTSGSPGLSIFVLHIVTGTVAKRLSSVDVLIFSTAALGEDARAIGIDQLEKQTLKPLIHIPLMKTDCN